MIFVSCGILPWRRAGFWCPVAREGFDDDHRATAFGARLMDIQIGRIIASALIRRLARLWLRIKQTPDPLDPVAADAIGEEASVADAVEAGYGSENGG